MPMQKLGVSEAILFDWFTLVSVPTVLYLLLRWQVLCASQSEWSVNP